MTTHRDITAVMLDLLEASEGHAVLSRHLMQHGRPVAGRGRPDKYSAAIYRAKPRFSTILQNYSELC